MNDINVFLFIGSWLIVCVDLTAFEYQPHAAEVSLRRVNKKGDGDGLHTCSRGIIVFNKFNFGKC